MPRRVLALIATACLGAACKDHHPLALPPVEAAPPGAAQEARVDLLGAGSTFVFPIMSKWVDEYDGVARTRVKYLSSGSSDGVKQITAQTVDFGASDVAMSDEELTRAPSPIVHIPITLGAVVVAYSREGLPARLKLSREVVAAIFLGDIKKWNDPRIAATNRDVLLPATEIAVYVRSDGSGTTGVFTKFLSNADRRWKERVGDGKLVKFPVGTGAKGNEGVALQLARTPGSVGYVELAYAKQTDLGLGYAYVENPAGKMVEPSLETTNAAAADLARSMPDDLRISIVDAPGDDAYPIASLVFALVYQTAADETRGKTLARFLWWVVHDGQKLGAPLHYAPLPREVVTLVEEKLRALKVPSGDPALRVN